MPARANEAVELVTELIDAGTGPAYGAGMVLVPTGLLIRAMSIISFQLGEIRGLEYGVDQLKQRLSEGGY